MSKNFTIVTGLWDIGRENLKDFNRSFDHYVESFEKLLSLDFNFCVWIPSDLIPNVKKIRSFDNTKIFVKELKEFKQFEHYNKIREIRRDPLWYSRAGWLENSPQCKLDYYNPIIMSKFSFLENCAARNPFNSDYFFWLDGGITNTVNPTFLEKLDSIDKYMNTIEDKFLMLSFPYESHEEVHGFEAKKFSEFCGKKSKYVCRGGFFGGTKDSIEKCYPRYKKIMEECFDSGYMGTEENFLTILSYRFKEDTARFELPDSLIYSFFDSL